MRRYLQARLAVRISEALFPNNASAVCNSNRHPSGSSFRNCIKDSPPHRLEIVSIRIYDGSARIIPILL